jgi:urease accessory protein
MDRDAKKMRGERPFMFTSLKSGDSVLDVVKFIVREGLLEERPLA